MSSLTPEQFQLLAELFHEFRGLSERDREQRLHELAETDPDLHEELVALLEDASEVGRREAGLEGLAQDASRLATPAPTVSGGKPGQEPSANDPVVSVDSVEEPRVLGRYRLIRRLGIGGMGEVWEAEQSEPVSRRVAVKILRQDYSSRYATAHGAQSVSRFRAERQALATMDHPHIARVFDGGETEDNQPYFVMELVEGGIPLTQYCARHGLNLEQRLRLFLPICDAVEHAHRKRIIHRDLKPSNVLVSQVAGRPVPKVIDFGIAKPIEESLRIATDHATQIGELVGTPEYMSPEQAALGSIDIDTRSDVYTLGLLLYELLVGELPMTGRELRALPFDELCRRIREDETPKPSTKLRQSAAGGATTAITGTTWRRVQGDLDRILGKALAKDRDQRYGSAAELADDVRRFLDNEPVLATPPSLGYQARKFFRRHRVAVVLGLLALLGLVTALVGVTSGLVRAQRAERIAETEATTATRVSAFLEELLREGNPERAQGAMSINDLLRRGSDKLRDDLHDEPHVRSRLLLTIASAYQALGEYDAALELLDEALALREDLYGENSPQVEHVLGKTSETLQRSGKLDQALEVAQRQHRVAQIAYQASDTRRAESLLQLGIVHWRLGEFDPALALLEEALALREGLLGKNDPSLAGLLNNVAILYWQTARPQEAANLYRRALAIQEAELGHDHPHVASTLNNLALVYDQTGDPEQAAQLHRQALDIRRKVFTAPHPDIAESLNNIGESLKDSGRLDEAIQVTEESLAMRRRIFPGDNDYVATSAFNLGVQLQKRDPVRSRALLLEALVMFESTLGPEHLNVSYPLLELGHLDLIEGRVGEAERLVRRALDLRIKALGPDHPMVLPPLRALADVLRTAGRTVEAQTALDQAEALEERLSRDQPLEGNGASPNGDSSAPGRPQN